MQTFPIRNAALAIGLAVTLGLGLINFNAFVDSIFGNSVEFWQRIFGGSTRYVLVGTLAFMGVGILAIVVGTVVGTVRKARDEY